MTRAVFLDRDGVLIEDLNQLTDASHIRLLPGVPEALARLQAAGYRLLVVSNQTVVARGLLTEVETLALHAEIERCLQALGAPPLDGFYFCPHHPRATLPEYRIACDCRKPLPGLLLRAAAEHGVDLSTSIMIGDRITDIAAGVAAGCRTIQVQTGKHSDPPIQTHVEIDLSLRPDFTCADLPAAAAWILEGMP
ncbi:MAG: D-glycero-alpha-D-manno-heptose-1,7-bisphosphate 7-phosphatase [Armatimonadota bacterium]